MSISIDTTVEVYLDDFDDDDLVQELESRGYIVREGYREDVLLEEVAEMLNSKILSYQSSEIFFDKINLIIKERVQ